MLAPDMPIAKSTEACCGRNCFWFGGSLQIGVCMNPLSAHYGKTICYSTRACDLCDPLIIR